MGKQYPEAKLTCSRSHCAQFGEPRYGIGCSSLRALTPNRYTNEERQRSSMVNVPEEREARKLEGVQDVLYRENKEEGGAGDEVSQIERSQIWEELIKKPSMSKLWDGSIIDRSSYIGDPVNYRIDLISCDLVQFISS